MTVPATLDHATTEAADLITSAHQDPAPVAVLDLPEVAAVGSRDDERMAARRRCDVEHGSGYERQRRRIASPRSPLVLHDGGHYPWRHFAASRVHEYVSAVDACADPRARSVLDTNLPTLRSGSRDFAQFHIWVDPGMTVRSAHRVMDEIEAELVRAFPDVEILIHLDPEGHVDKPTVPADPREMKAVT